MRKILLAYEFARNSQAPKDSNSDVKTNGLDDLRAINEKSNAVLVKAAKFEITPDIVSRGT